MVAWNIPNNFGICPLILFTAARPGNVGEWVQFSEVVEIEGVKHKLSFMTRRVDETDTFDVDENMLYQWEGE